FASARRHSILDFLLIQTIQLYYSRKDLLLNSWRAHSCVLGETQHTGQALSPDKVTHLLYLSSGHSCRRLSSFAPQVMVKTAGAERLRAPSGSAYPISLPLRRPSLT